MLSQDCKKAKKKDDSDENDGVVDEEDNKFYDVDPEDCPNLSLCIELLAFKIFRSDPLLLCSLDSDEAASDDGDIDQVIRKVKS